MNCYTKTARCLRALAVVCFWSALSPANATTDPSFPDWTPRSVPPTKQLTYTDNTWDNGQDRIETVFVRGLRSDAIGVRDDGSPLLAHFRICDGEKCVTSNDSAGTYLRLASHVTGNGALLGGFKRNLSYAVRFCDGASEACDYAPAAGTVSAGDVFSLDVEPQDSEARLSHVVTAQSEFHSRQINPAVFPALILSECALQEDAIACARRALDCQEGETDESCAQRVATAPVNPPPLSGESGFLWIAQSQGLLNVDTREGELRGDKPHTLGYSAVGVNDVNGDVWAYQLPDLVSYNRFGEQLSVTPVPLDPHVLPPSDLVVDGVAGSLWIAIESSLYQYDLAGAHRQMLSLPAPILALTLDRSTSTLWVALPDRLLAYDEEGSLVKMIGPVSPLTAILDAAFDRSLGELWVARHDGLDRYDSNGNLVFTQAGDFGGVISPDGANGLWLARLSTLRHVNAMGFVDAEIEAFGDLADKLIVDLAGDPTDASVWVATSSRIRHYALNAQLVHDVNPGEARKLNRGALYSDLDPPELEFTAPANSSAHGTATPTFSLSFFDLGVGVDTATLSFTVDNAAAIFNCTYTASSASCTPASQLANGSRVVKATIKDAVGNQSATTQRTVVIDTTPPVITITQPADGSYTNQSSATISGSISEPASLTVNGASVLVDGSNTFSHGVTLEEGANSFGLIATDAQGYTGDATVTVTLDTAIPNAPDSGLIAATISGAGQITLTGAAGSVEGGAIVRIRNTRTGEIVTVIAAADGSFIVNLAGAAGDELEITQVDRAENKSPLTTRTATPADPALVAPALSETQFTNMQDAVSFLYSGASPVQFGVQPGAIDPSRVAVLRGRVITRDGAALHGVKIVVKDHPELGYTLSRNDGAYDLAVNGGGDVFLDFSRDNHLPAQRQVSTPWRQYTSVDDVALVELDPVVTQVGLGGGAPLQMATSGVVSDAEGSRQATLVFPSGLAATMTLPDGSSAPLTEMSVRATEYTVGVNGKAAMPAALPVLSGYTYAAEFSVDQAIAAGAKSVQFSQPVPVYVDNYLDFPVGIDVPSGYYDREKGQWIPSPNGRIVKVLSEDGNGAVLDVLGAGQPATQAQLDGLGITAEERLAIAARYNAGDEFWRVPVTHFTGYDFNWPWGLPDGAESPPSEGPDEAPLPDSKDTCPVSGCVINPTSQSLGEDIGLVGVPYGLHYRSDRTQAGRSLKRVTVPLSDSSIPTDLRKIRLRITVGGTTYRQSFDPAANLKHTYEWDGRDAYGRQLRGTYGADVEVTYVYAAKYYTTAAGQSNSFGSAAGSGVGAVAFGQNRALREITASRKWSTPLDAGGLGGWSLTPHHYYDPASKTLHMGDGSKTTSANVGLIVQTMAGGGSTTGFNIPARKSNVTIEGGVAINAAGELFFAGVAGTGVRRIMKVDKAGILRLLATFSSEFIHDMDFGPDGMLYFTVPSTGNPGMIRKLDPATGVVTTVLSGVIQPKSIDVAQDGTIYYMDHKCDNNANPYKRLRKIAPDGTASVVLTIGSTWCDNMAGIAVGPDGSVYMATLGGVNVLTPQGVHKAFLPGGTSVSGDGGPVSLAKGAESIDVAVGSDGTVYIAEATAPARIRAVTPDGIINTIAGGGTVGVAAAEGGPARMAIAHNDVTLGQDGALYETQSNRVRKYTHAFADYSPTTFTLVSRDGSQLYSFSNAGRHLNTRDAFTGATIYSFGYDTAGRLTSITDIDGDVTTIERDAAGYFDGIVGPDGHRTDLGTNAEGLINSVIDPAGQAYSMTYDVGGLLRVFENPREQVSNYTYDPVSGGLTNDVDPRGGGWSLNTTAAGKTSTTTMTSAEGRISTFAAATLVTGSTQQTMTGPDGLVTTRVNNTNATTVSTTPDGTITEVKEFADPRFGAQAPITTTTVKTPSLLTSTATTSRSLTLADPYDPLSSLNTWSETTAVNGKNFVRSYAAGTKTWTSSSPLNRQSITVLDIEGRPATSRYANFETTTYDYLANGRLNWLTTGSAANARTTDFSYYADGYRKGWLQSVTDAENRTVSYDYDLAGRVTTQTLPDNRVIGYGYDANGNLTSITPPGRDAHVFHYDAGDLEDLYTPPDAANVGLRFTEYSYNLDKDLDLIKRPDGQLVDFVYEGPGKKLSSIIIPTGTYGYTYKPTTGQLDTVTAPGGQSLAYSYDGFLLTSEVASGVVPGTVSWTYNNDFRVTSQTAAGNGVSFGYDNDGLLTSVGPTGCAGATCLSLVRNPTHGLITSTTFLTNTTTTHTYNTFGEPATDVAKYGATTLYSASYPVRDKLGRIKQKVEAVEGVQTQYDYTYDTAGRLDTVTIDGVLARDYAYDANGNRCTPNAAGDACETDSQLQQRIYDGQDRLTSYDGTSYTYTANGELFTKTDASGATTYGYDVLGNLRTVALPGGTSLEYVIDGRNRRVGKKVDGVLVQGLLYGNQLEPVAELDGSGNLVSRFVYGSKAHVPDYMVKAGVTYRIVSDHLGSVRLVVSTIDGSIAQRMDYDEFGVVLPTSTNPGFQPFGFAGGVYDQHTKLTRFGVRDYDAGTGRWTAKDPIGFSSGASNSFAYVGSDPVNYVDPDGKIALPLAGGLLIAGGLVNAAISGYSEYRRTGSLSGSLGEAGEGFVSGVVGTATAIAVATATKNVKLAGASGALAGSLVGQLFDRKTDPVGAFVSTATGGLLGPALIGTRGRLPDLLKPRSLSEYGPNSQRMLGEEALDGAIGGMCGVATDALTDH